MISFEPANLGFSGKHNNHYTTESDVPCWYICCVCSGGNALPNSRCWYHGCKTTEFGVEEMPLSTYRSPMVVSPLYLCRVQLFFLILNVILVF